MKICLHVLLLATIAATVCGCNSVYHMTMREYKQPHDELLLRRVADAQQTLGDVRKHLAFIVTMSSDLDDHPQKSRGQRAHLIAVRLNKAELGVWNTHRRILAVNDRLDGTVADEEGQQALTVSKRQTLRDAIAVMSESHADLDAAVIELRSHVNALGSGERDEQVNRFQQAITDMSGRLDRAIRRSEQASMQVHLFLESLSDFEVAAATDASD